MSFQLDKIFVNLPVKDLKKSMEFFSQIGFTFNPQFTDEKATCMVIHEHIYAMLLVNEYFKTFTSKLIVDAQQHTEVIVSLSAQSREEVDIIVNRALDAGGQAYADTRDLGFMYQRSFADLDGHQWEIFYMDPSVIQSHS